MRGGARAGAGRKRKSELITARDVIRESISPRDWLALVKSLYRSAAKGNLRAAELLFRYNYGDPKQVEPPDRYQQPLRIIEFPEPPPGGWPPGTDLSNIRPVTPADLVRYDKIDELHRLKAEIERKQIEK